MSIRKFLEGKSNHDYIEVLSRRISEDESFEMLLFPFYLLEDHNSWTNRLEEYLDNKSVDREYSRQIRRILGDKLNHFYSGFEIPYITLPKTVNLSQVSDIFEGINTKGIQLNVFDLLIARLYKDNIGLRDLYDKTLNSNSKIQEYASEINKIPVYILQAISLLYNRSSSCKKQDILDIYQLVYSKRNTKFEQDWEEMSSFTNEAIIKLENLKEDGFGVKNCKELPFAPTIPILAALLKSINLRKDQANCFKKLRMWYWSSVFSNAYSSAVDTQLTQDFKQMLAWFEKDEQIPDTIITARNRLQQIDLHNVKSKGSAIYKGVLSILAIEGARDFDTGQTLENARGNDKDHIFPRAGEYEYGLQKYIDSVLNMTWMSDKTNRGIKKFKKPSVYTKEFIKVKHRGDTKEFKSILKTHLINDPTAHCMEEDNFGSFLKERERIIIRKIANLIGAPPEIADKLEENSNQVIDELEERLREVINEKLQSISEKDYWKEQIPGDIQEEVKKKVAERLKRFPQEANEKYDEGYELIVFCNIMDYVKIILKNWNSFADIFVSKAETEKHFANFNTYRNAIKHNRPMNNIERKQGEASMEWLVEVLKI